MPGVILVIANSSQANWAITGPANYQGNGWNYIYQNVSPGTYTITWGTIAGCGTPPSETKTTEANGSVGFAGNYKDLSAPAGYGLIDIKTNLNQPTTFMVSGPATQTDRGTGFIWASAPVGTYTVSYGAIAGYNTPSSETKTLSVGGTLNFYGNYTIKKTTTSSIQHFVIESKPVSGANAYVKISDTVSEVFVGKTPAGATAYFGSTVNIRCSLEGYEDYRTSFRAPDAGSGVIVVNPVTYCFLTSKAVHLPADPSAPQGPNKPGAIPSGVPNQPVSPPGFFSRIWKTFFSLFKFWQ